MSGRREAHVEAAAGSVADPARSEDGDTAQARFLLELRSRGLTDPALFEAFERVPRVAFMPETEASLLYAPVTLPIACGEMAEDPFTLARQMVLAQIAPGQRILEIGTGSGFGTALMAAAGAEVVTLERYATLGLAAIKRFNRLGLMKISCHQADGLAKRSVSGPFDRLVIGGAMDIVPQSLFEGLVPGGIAIGGRLRAGQTRLTQWRIDSSGFPIESDLGPLRMGRMRANLPSAL